jgi:hypothetical protein
MGDPATRFGARRVNREGPPQKVAGMTQATVLWLVLMAASLTGVIALA